MECIKLDIAVTGNMFMSEFFQTLDGKIRAVDNDLLVAVADMVQTAADAGGKVIFVGNGGSAAMASHLSVDFTKSVGIRGFNFNEADFLTCFANDYGYENWVSEAIKVYADPHDLIVLISSSGQSENIVNGALCAKKMGLKVITLSGFSTDNPLRKLGDLNLWADSDMYNIVEMTHHVWMLAVAEYMISKRSRPEA